MASILFWVLGGVVLVLGIYSNYTNWKTYFAAKKAKEEFMKNHPDAEVTYAGKNRPWFYTLFAVICLCLASFMVLAKNVEMDFNQRFSMSLVYFALAVYLAAMAVEAQTDSRICYTPDGFIFTDKYMRYKQITSVEVGGNFFKSSFIHFGGKEQISTPKYIAAWVQENWVEWRKNRDAKRKKGKHRS